MELTERKRQILKLVVEGYIRQAEPVGSKAIAAAMPGKVSSATIRNELADLTDLGYLEQPHTSAGRVPSPKGYRFYVNELMEAQRLSLAETERINSALQTKMQELDRVIAQAGRTVSGLMQYPAYVAAAGKQTALVRRFDLLPVDERSCIVVVLTGEERVKSQLLKLPLRIDQTALPRLANFMNEKFTGIASDEMNLRLMDAAEELPPPLFLLLNQAVGYAGSVLEESARREIVTSGASSLLRLPEFRDTDRASELMQFLTDGKDSLPVPDESGKMKLLIGPENVNEALHNTSVMVASYDIGDHMRGLVGVVGPTRMDYAAVSARLAGVAAAMERLFGERSRTQELPAKEEPK